MSKGLEALEHIRKVNYYEDEEEIDEDCFGIEKDLSIIEQELKAIEILVKVFKEEININYLDLDYLTQEEYELLKEVLL